MTAPSSGDAPAEQLLTVLDLVRYASSRFNAAGLAFGHGTDNAVDEAIFLVCEALHLPSERIDAMLPARLLGS